MEYLPTALLGVNEVNGPALSTASGIESQTIRSYPIHSVHEADGGFLLVMGVPPVIIHFDRIFPYKPSIYRGTPRDYGNLHLAPDASRLPGPVHPGNCFMPGLCASWYLRGPWFGMAEFFQQIWGGGP